ncbi:hypothetical protein GCM10009749_04770 [Agromyces neolithicus]|uniref:Uncharacterized protein n=1 Tax=Agromyces neolithicus TaxID=269420 RepID=A0ABN2LXM7_9MICO
MASPEAGEFEWPDQSQLFTVTRECRCEGAPGFEVLTEKFGGSGRFWLESVDHGFT